VRGTELGEVVLRVSDVTVPLAPAATLRINDHPAVGPLEGNLRRRGN
jgi:hypothetical protein